MLYVVCCHVLTADTIKLSMFLAVDILHGECMSLKLLGGGGGPKQHFIVRFYAFAFKQACLEHIDFAE